MELGLEDSSTEDDYYGGALAPVKEVFDALRELGGIQLAITYGKRYQTGNIGKHQLMEIPVISNRTNIITGLFFRLTRNVLPILHKLVSFQPKYVISIHGWTFRHLIPLVYCLISPSRLIIVITGEYPRPSNASVLRRALARVLIIASKFRAVHTVGARSKTVFSQLIEAGVPEKKLRVLYPYFGGYRQLLKRIKPLSGDDRFSILFVARLVEEKEPFFFVDLAHRLLKRTPSPNMTFSLIGDGPLRNAVDNRVTDLGLEETVKVRGYLRSTEVFSNLLAADLLVVPSRCEALGKVAVESLLALTPVVASRVGGLQDVIMDGQNGFLCEPGCLADFELRILELYNSPGSIRTMRENMRTHRESWLNRESSFGLLIYDLFPNNETRSA